MFLQHIKRKRIVLKAFLFQKLDSKRTSPVTSKHTLETAKAQSQSESTRK